MKLEIMPDDSPENNNKTNDINNSGELAAAYDLDEFKTSFAKCEKERQEFLDGWQRTKAEHINYRRDEAKRFEDMARFVTAGLVQDVLPVLDSFTLALSHGLPSEVEKGVLLIKSQFCDILKKRGLEEIKVSAGELFNPEKHESIGEVESEYPAGVVAEEVQKGYYFQGKVLRPARVRLSKTK